MIFLVLSFVFVFAIRLSYDSISLNALGILISVYISRTVGILQKLRYFFSGLCIENSIPFINVVAPTILHIIMGKLMLFTST